MTAGLIKCDVCGRELSSDAKVCIHCGHPLKRRNFRLIAIAGGALVLAAICIWLGIGLVYGFITGWQGHPGLPSCESSHGQADAKRAMENSPFAKNLSLTIITMTDPKSVALNSNRVVCQATVIFNNSEKRTLGYSFTKDPSMPSGQYLVRAWLGADSSQP